MGVKNRGPIGVLALTAILVACSSGETADSTVTSTSGGTTTTAAPDGRPTSFQEVQPAVIQIVAQGTFRDPELGFSDGSGLGSGFIISPEGLAVTNNHVVAGAATLEVFIGGDTEKSYNATIVGVSECNDLAVIDIAESEPLPYLDWYDGEISPGLAVYAAGFPLGDPEYTLTSGIVSKARAGGDLTGTSSIDHTIEHDANIQPGNSGGPLVAEDGTVVAVNYAGGATATTTAQFYGIASDLAQPVIAKLMDGDFETLGINGWAVFDDAAAISGVWVAGVAAGSPAAAAEILPGDIITSMNGLPIGTDGTFKDYCDVIRTAGDNPIGVDVLRYDTSEVLRGEINGTQPIEAAFSFAEEIQDEVSVDESSPAAAYTDYQSIVDDTGKIVIEVPVEWSDIDPAPATDDAGGEIPYILAATDRQAWLDTFDVPGVLFVKLGPTDDIPSTLLEYGDLSGNCTDLGLVDYSDPVFTGQYQVWDACGGTPTAVVVLAAVPADNSYTALMMVQIVSDADLDALDRIFQTFNVIG
ncbi:MAG TPA: S1C family serine protease [Acidimicrobiia bacterium]|nr:S1C family serine protease [Acidimicrobiia bacterium]